jgi:SAM-dependent methyltransferase
MSGLGLSAAIARRLILWSQNTRYRGSSSQSVNHTSAAPAASTPFPQADSEASDYESFFRLFPNHLIKDALKGKTVLDFGSGYGGRTVEYKLCGAARVCGVEPFEHVVALSRQYAEHRGVRDVEFKVCSHREIPYPDASFDVVISYDVLEHVEDPRQSVAEIWRVLRPGGLSLNVFPVYFGARSHHLDYLSNLPGLHWMFSPLALVRAVNSIRTDQGLGDLPQPGPRRSFDGTREVLPELNGLSSWHLSDVFHQFEAISVERHPLHWWEPGRGRIAKAVAHSSLPDIIKDAATGSMACILRKPGDGASLLAPPADSSSTARLSLLDWTVRSPARLEDNRIIMRGAAASGQAYAATSPVYRLPRGGRVVVAGMVRRGGLTIGLLDHADRFANQLAVDRGHFRKFMDAPVDGEYRIVIANNVTAWQAKVDGQIDEIGLVDLDPAACRLRSEITRITPLPAGAWEAIYLPARLQGQALRIKGAPVSPSAYAATSALFRFPKGTLVAASGTVHRGGMQLGLVDGRDQWAAMVLIGEGTFRNGIEAPSDGDYRIVIANHLSERQTTADVEVREIGLVERDAADYRVQAPAIGTIEPFQPEDWAAIHPRTRLDGRALHLSGKPSSLLEYAAESVTYRLPQGAVIAVAGTARSGRIMLGLLDANSRWAATTVTCDGEFRTGVEVPVDGEYRLILATMLARDTHAAAEVREIGFVGLAPSSHRVASAPRVASSTRQPWRRLLGR